MAGRGGERFQKRQRERDRQEKAQAKRARREERKEQAAGADGPSEDELLAAVAALNAQHAEKQIDEEEYATRRAELFEQLGLEP
jgi:hypothetical protein